MITRDKGRRAIECLRQFGLQTGEHLTGCSGKEVTDHRGFTNEGGGDPGDKLVVDIRKVVSERGWLSHNFRFNGPANTRIVRMNETKVVCRRLGSCGMAAFKLRDLMSRGERGKTLRVSCPEALNLDGV